MKHDDFGDRMKELERQYTSLVVPVSDILCVRLDGKGFSKFTKNFKKPFDQTLSDVMVETTKQLVKELAPKIAYVQSDEISLIFSTTEKQTEHIFGGKVSKINSIVASMCSVYFNHYLKKSAPVPIAGNGLAFFDCRSWGVPDLAEASNVILWRVQDARKNSISSLFRWTVGHSKMHGLSGEEMKALLKSDYFTDWDELPNRYKYGTYVKPTTVETYLTQSELVRIPEHKRPEADVLVKRTRVQELDLGFFGDYTLEQRVEYVK